MTPFEENEWGVRVTAAARLSFTLVDMNGEAGRRNGMASLSLREPSFQATLDPAHCPSVEADDNATAHTQAIGSFLESLRQKWEGPPVRVQITRGLPPNSGFGSKTTSLLALGKAYGMLCGRGDACTDELARVARRAGTAGGSVNLIDRGGFVVDGGHANPEDFSENSRQYLVPSRFAGASRKPPVLIHLNFPPWPILIIRGVGNGLSGEAELEFFQQTLPIPVAEARRTGHLVLMNLAPAIAEADYTAFCRAVNTLTYETYFKQRQIQTQTLAVQAMIRDAAKRSDVDAIGMSSMGPTCYVLTRQPASVTSWLQGLCAEGAVHSFWFTSAQNHPAILEGVPISPT